MIEVFRLPGNPSGIGWLPDGDMLVVSMHERRLYRRTSGALVVHAELGVVHAHHSNDMVVDGQGRAYVGNIGFDFHGGEEVRSTAMALGLPDGTVELAADGLASPNGTVITPDGRTVGFATYGPDSGTPVVWCHGGPGSRLEPAGLAPFLDELGLRVIGIDRPGYGLSSLRPGRSIADFVPDGLAVVDRLGVERRRLGPGCPAAGEGHRLGAAVRCHAQRRDDRSLGIGALRAIPSLAIMAAMLPLIGVGFRPALIALTILAIPPMLINTQAGIMAVNPAITEAAPGMGLSRWQIIGQVQLPLALPVIVTGVRIASVEVIASATARIVIFKFMVSGFDCVFSLDCFHDVLPPRKQVPVDHVLVVAGNLLQKWNFQEGGGGKIEHALARRGGQQRGRDHGLVRLGDMRQDVTHAVHSTALPGRAAEGLHQRSFQPLMGVADHQPHATQPASDQTTQELQPERGLFTGAHRKAQHLPITALPHANGHHHRHGRVRGRHDHDHGGRHGDDVDVAGGGDPGARR